MIAEVDLSKCVTAEQIGAMAHASKSSVTNWKDRNLIPAPITKVGSSYLWDRQEVIEALELMGFSPGLCSCRKCRSNRVRQRRAG